MMTNEEKYKQLTQVFGAYSKRLEALYDRFIDRLSVLAYKTGVGVDDLLQKNPLFRFGNFPELRKELNDIFADYVQKDILAYHAGITDGVALAYSHDALVLSGVSILSDKAIRAARETAAETFIRNRMKSENGLNLSQTVWNYASQSKSEFDMALSNVIADGLRKGTSAAELSLRVRMYLNNPDMMYRRYHQVFVDKGGNKRDIVKWRKKVVDDSGKVRFVETPLEAVGTGIYRSSRKNADRVMRTEINASYHRANAERWQLEPFVIGIIIDLSPQHPQEDECDELAGRYPKDFFFTGWHAQCLCMSNPITIQGEEKKQFYKRLAAGEDMSNYVSPNAVKDIPDRAKAWIDANKEKFIRAAERGKLGWVWRDNMKYIGRQFSPEELAKMGYAPQHTKRIKTEAEKADIQRRWNERKKNNEILTRGKAFEENLRDFPTIDITGLKKAIADKDYQGITMIVDGLRPRLKFERSITPDILRDSVMRKKYGDEAVDALYSNVKRTIANNVTGDIDAKIRQLRFEADWVVRNRSFATVKEVAAYYEREAVRLEAMKRFEEVRNEILAIEKNLSKYGVKTVLSGSEWYGDINTLEVKLKGLEAYKTKFERIAKLEEYAKTSKSPDIKAWNEGIKYAIQQNGIDANVDDLLRKAEERIKRIEYDKAYTIRKKHGGALNPEYKGGVEGKDITDSIDTAKMTSEDPYRGTYTNNIARLQGFDSPAKLVSEEEFAFLEKQCGEVFYRTVNETEFKGVKMTSKEFASQLYKSPRLELNGPGGRVHGDGMYVATSSWDGYEIKTLTDRLKEMAKNESLSYGYGRHTLTEMTWTRKPRVIKATELERRWDRLSYREQKRFGGHINTYGCALGYDAMYCDGPNYMVIWNRSIIAVKKK